MSRVYMCVCVCMDVCSLIPRPSISPFFDHLSYAKMEESYHMICIMADVTDSSSNSLFTFTVTEKLENKGRYHTVNINWFEA